MRIAIELLIIHAYALWLFRIVWRIADHETESFDRGEQW